MIGVRFEPHDVVRLGIIGVGLRGTETLKEFLAVDKVVVNAVCDVVKDKCTRAAQLIEKAGQKTPAITRTASEILNDSSRVTISTSSTSRRRGSGTFRKRSR